MHCNQALTGLPCAGPAGYHYFLAKDVKLEKLIQLIQNSKSIILSTHRQCDGDGLGAELALYHCLQKLGKKVQIIHVDEVPKKYRFLQTEQIIQVLDSNHTEQVKADLCLILDTNDRRLLGELYPRLEKNCPHIAFIDHHPILTNGPAPTTESWIYTSAASTGEMVFDLIQKLNIPLDTQIARALYVSITFDTQLYRFIRNSPRSHQIAAKLLEFPIQATDIHRALFGNQTVKKIAFLAKTLSQIEYFGEGKIAFLRIQDDDLFKYDLETEDSRDVIDMIMNIEGLEAAVLLREDEKNEYKISLRSKGVVPVLSIAESFGGGGHQFSAGVYCKGQYQDIKNDILNKLLDLMK